MRRRAKGWLRRAASLGSVFSSAFFNQGCYVMSALLGLLGSASSAATVPATDVYELSIPSGTPLESLTELSSQTDLRIRVLRDLPREPLTQPVSGQLSGAAAIRVMLSGTNLTYAFVGPDAVEVWQADSERRWFDIPAGPAQEGIRAFLDTVHWDGVIDSGAIWGARTSAVRGCLTPEAAAERLFAKTEISYELNIVDPDSRTPLARLLTVRQNPGRSSPWWHRMLRLRTIGIVPDEDRAARCWAICDGTTNAPPAMTCLIKPGLQR